MTMREEARLAKEAALRVVDYNDNMVSVRLSSPFWKYRNALHRTAVPGRSILGLSPRKAAGAVGGDGGDNKELTSLQPPLSLSAEIMGHASLARRCASGRHALQV